MTGIPSSKRNQARSDCDRAERNSLTVEQKEDINALRRAERNSLTAEQKEEINARRRAQRNEKKEHTNARESAARQISRQSKTEEERATMLAQRRAKAAARRNNPCKESIAMPCPKQTTLLTKNLQSNTSGSPAKEGNASANAYPSTSTPEYTIRTNGNHRYTLYFSCIMVH